MSDYEKKWNEAMRELVRLRAFNVILTDVMKQVAHVASVEDAVYLATEALRMTTPPNRVDQKGEP